MTSLDSSPAPDVVARLHALYHDASKHSVYQSVPTFVSRALGYQEEIHSLWRSDQPRYDYILPRLDVVGSARVADIGANTGYFSLNLAHDRPELAIAAYEMNPRHAEFIALTAGIFGLDQVDVRSESCDLAGLARLPACDVVMLLNVLHHAGFDFDAHVPDDNAAFTAHATTYLARLRERAGRLVLQIGSNRGGDKRRPLFPYDDDLARLDWLARILRAAGWCASHLGYADLSPDGRVVFRDVPAGILGAVRAGHVRKPEIAAWLAAARLDRFPGEFHRRPLVLAQADHPHS
jgi:hypothetical protein